MENIPKKEAMRLFKGTYYKVSRITRKSRIHYFVKEINVNENDTETHIVKLSTQSKVRIFLFILKLKLRGFRQSKYGEMTQDTYISYYRKPKSEIP
jgi:hypothetical protein